MEEKDTAKPTILLIEDDIVLAKMYTEKFKHEGFEVVVATDGEKGLELALQIDANIILLDLMLPRVSGIDLLEKLRQDGKGKEIPVIALTNLADPNEKKRVLDLGAQLYLVKAMQSPEQVVEEVKKNMK